MRGTGAWRFRRCGTGAYRMRPYGGERRRVRVGADYISARAHRRVGCTFAERTHRRGAHRASVAGCDLRSAGGRCTWSRRHVGMPPYVRSGWRTALHTAAGGPMWASAPTRGTIEPQRDSEPGSGRPYRPPLRRNRRRVCRGGFYIRPCRRVGCAIAGRTSRRGAA